ncbi:efflux transporter outer membrane subunit [Craterilacuibacter sp.]|uniref:efflux transporter outer membrane subunit n=1 Tax=Craterilacuibacter sp. TaxID=2870909 RepID=UPI003F327566
MNYKINHYRTKLPLLAGCALLLLSACANMKDGQPRAIELTPASYGLDAGARQPVQAQGAWWKALQQKELNQLIDHALAAHPSLTLAQARIRQAGANLALTDAGDGPQLDLQASHQRLRISEYGLLPPPLAGNWFSLNQLSLNLSWRLDFWGKTRALLAAANSQQQAARLEAEDSRNWLASAVTAQYFEYMAARHSLQLLQQDQGLLASQLKQAQALVASGIASGDASDSVLREQQQLATRLATANIRIAQARHALAALTTLPDTQLAGLPLHPLPQWQLDSSQLSTRALARRPDIMAQQARVEAAASGIKAAKADFYPDVTLGAVAGLQAQNLGDLFSRGALASAITPGFTLPLFHSGALNAALDARSAHYDAAIASYNQTLLAAIQEAADSVSQTQGSQQAYTATRAALVTQARIARRSHSRLASGLIAPSQNINDQRHTLAAALENNEAHARQLQAQTVLLRALAGSTAMENK